MSELGLVCVVVAGEEYALQALKAGASGYLLKDADLAELELGIWAVARGETYLSPAVSKHLVADYRRRAAEHDQPDPLARLTSRHREVLQLIAEGSSTKEIARKLAISVKTVESHRTNAFRTLGVHSVSEVVRYAIRNGIVEG